MRQRTTNPCDSFNLVDLVAISSVVPIVASVRHLSFGVIIMCCKLDPFQGFIFVSLLQVVTRHGVLSRLVSSDCSLFQKP